LRYVEHFGDFNWGHLVQSMVINLYLYVYLYIIIIIISGRFLPLQYFFRCCEEVIIHINAFMFSSVPISPSSEHFSDLTPVATYG
jgi:hypothetical protein